MSDSFTSHADGVSSPSRNAFAIVPHDSNPLPRVVKAIYVGTAGNVTLRTVDGSADVLFKNVAAGQVLDVRAAFVRAAGTNAADLVGLA
ncbi:MAG TPA: hypothetical protein VEZ41_03595 [Allosphingosinicella sp.]|nr:hypothetical protein [Allosphingosinicella sp.]